MSVFAGQGDPTWTMAALWRTAGTLSTRPGPKPALSLDAIVAAAVEIADRDGLAGLSMKAVGEHFGRTAMSLYTYVPGKNELVDLMVDRAHAELPTAYDTTPGWRTAVTEWAHDLFDFHQRHPWTLHVSFARPALGPHEQNVVETLAVLLEPTRLQAAAVRRTVGVLIHFVRAVATTAADAHAAATDTGTTDADWWTARSKQLLDVAPDFAQRYPMTTWLASATDPDEDGDPDGYLKRQTELTLNAGLAMLLDGIEVAMSRTREASR